MPLYEYRCAKCGSTCEVLVQNKSDQPKSCPECGGEKLEKLLSSFAVSMGPSASDAAACESCPGCPGGGCPYGGDDDY